jgi:hypothetical protein
MCPGVCCDIAIWFTSGLEQGAHEFTQPVTDPNPLIIRQHHRAVFLPPTAILVREMDDGTERHGFLLDEDTKAFRVVVLLRAHVVMVLE